MTRPKEPQETFVDFSFTKHYHLNHVMQLIVLMYRDSKILNAARTWRFMWDAVLL
ncbi:hypothetical protein FOFC_16599 [Fusarium oxysporum]|nr:hypothetical protein FOFC_16599 [Fusarium oxysporum]